jgi:hypothetical protein
MQKVQAEVFSSFISPPPIFRYVDDLLILTSDELNAKRIFLKFNENLHNLNFTIELPVDNSIPFLDFRLYITQEGMATFEFYRKPMRNDNFVNVDTALPKQKISNIITNENVRIINRCTTRERAKYHTNNFVARLGRNGHNPNFF